MKDKKKAATNGLSEDVVMDAKNESTVKSFIIPTIEEIEDFVANAGSDHTLIFGGIYEGGIHIQQVPDEIAPCIHKILTIKPDIDTYLEIGAAAGGTAYLMNKYLSPAKMVLVDDNHHPKHMLRPDILSEIQHEEVIGDSKSAEVKTQLETMKRNGYKFDVILIDGNHTFEGVLSDFTFCKDLVSDDGFIIFHDSDCRECYGVNQAVIQIKGMEDMELVGEYKTLKWPHQCGIALFRKRGWLPLPDMNSLQGVED
jgi:cephalosporin hydroxylase